MLLLKNVSTGTQTVHYSLLRLIKMEILLKVFSKGSEIYFGPKSSTNCENLSQLFSKMNKPPINEWFQITHSSVIFEYTGGKGDSFQLDWECRRYFIRPNLDNDKILEFSVSARYPDMYTNFEDPDAPVDLHCTSRGLYIGKDFIGKS